MLKLWSAAFSRKRQSGKPVGNAYVCTSPYTVLRNIDCLRHEMEEATLLAVVPGLQDEICVRMLVCATEVRSSLLRGGGIDVRVGPHSSSLREVRASPMACATCLPRATVRGNTDFDSVSPISKCDLALARVSRRPSQISYRYFGKTGPKCLRNIELFKCSVTTFTFYIAPECWQNFD